MDMSNQCALYKHAEVSKRTKQSNILKGTVKALISSRRK